jgi:hypothetical protein
MRRPLYAFLLAAAAFALMTPTLATAKDDLTLTGGGTGFVEIPGGRIDAIWLVPRRDFPGYHMSGPPEDPIQIDPGVSPETLSDGLAHAAEPVTGVSGGGFQGSLMDGGLLAGGGSRSSPSGAAARLEVLVRRARHALDD